MTFEKRISADGRATLYRGDSLEGYVGLQATQHNYEATPQERHGVGR